MKKFIAAGISVILVVGVVIGVVVVTNKNSSSSSEKDGTVSTSTKSVQQMCAPTDYKDKCETVLNKVNDTSDPKQYISAIIQATLDAAGQAFNLSDDLVVKANSSNDAKTALALDECKELLQDAVDELQAAFSMVGDSEMHTMDKRVAELQNWFSAVMSYQETCLDQFGDQENATTKTAIQNGMTDAGQLTSNALAIVNGLSNILAQFGLQFNIPNPNSRRLLDVCEDCNKYPSWLSSARRSLLATPDAVGDLKPNVVVAKDGSGQFKTITDALNAYPGLVKGGGKGGKKGKGAAPPANGPPFVVYVKAGVYAEYVTVTRAMSNVIMYGDGPDKTIITGNKCNTKGFKTMNSGTFEALGDGFLAKAMGFQNTAGAAGHQAVAIRVQGDMAVFYNCWIDGYQDTLYAQAHRQLYNNCTITGTIDFIFGDASVVIQNSKIVVRLPLDNQQNTVTAHGRVDKHETTGIVIQNCQIVAEDKLVPAQGKNPSYLGRPWKAFSRAIIMESQISNVIHPDGWLPWAGTLYLDTLFFAEFGNSGPGSNTANRVKWKGIQKITNADAATYAAGPFLQADKWLNVSNKAAFPMGLVGKH